MLRVIIGFLLAAPACSFDDSGLEESGDDGGPVVAEAGTWLLKEYDLDGDRVFDEVPDSRKDGFVMHFDSAMSIVAVATCQDQDEHDAGVPGALTSSLCAQSGPPELWFCQCFWYDYQDNSMCWGQPGGVGGKPSVDECATDGGETLVAVKDDEAATNTIFLSPLPGPVWESRAGSSYRISKKNDPVFEHTGCLSECGL